MRWAEICKKIQKEENRGATLPQSPGRSRRPEASRRTAGHNGGKSSHTAPQHTQSQATETSCWGSFTPSGFYWFEWLSFRHAGMLSLRWITLTSCCQAASTFFLSRSYSLAGLLSPQSSLLSAPGKAAWIIEPAVWNSLTGGKQAKSSGFSLAFIPLLYLGIALTLPQNFPHLAWPWDLFSIPEFSIPVGRMNVKHGGL